MNRIERRSGSEYLEKALSLIDSIQITGEPVCFAVDFEHVLQQPYYEGTDYRQNDPQTNSNLIDFLQHTVAHIMLRPKAGQIIIANASNMVADPQTIKRLDKDSVGAYIEKGEQILKNFGCTFMRIPELAKLGRKSGAIFHINDLQISPALARCSPPGWLTYASTVTPFGGISEPTTFDNYVKTLVETFHKVDTQEILASESNARAFVLRSFR